MPHMVTVPVYVLAGGRSLRFGNDKALAEIGGGTLIQHVSSQWATYANQVVAVADRTGKYESLGLRTIADLQPGLGPIGGLLTSLEDCGEGWLLLTACDVIVLDTELPQRLLSSITDDVKAIALRGPQWETMPALYHSSILPVVRAAIAKDQRALWKIIEQVPHRAIEYAEDQPLLAQINTRDDLRRFISGNAP